MSDPAAFIHAFHADLTAWFSGAGEKTDVWKRLGDSCPETMLLVYPSGQRLGGAEFLRSIQDHHSASPGFVARAEVLEVISCSDTHAVVMYREHQTGARASAASNSRSSMGLVVRAGERWVWRAVQETNESD